MIDHLFRGAFGRHVQPALRLSALAAAVLVASCGGGSGGGTTSSTPDFSMVTGSAACGGGGCGGDGTGGGVGGDGGSGSGDGAGGGLGEMRNVRVTARKPDGTTLASAVLTNNLVSIYDRNYKGAFILEFADDGSGSSAYYDEGSATWTPLNGQALRILVPQLTHHVSANPLTEAAYQWALNKYGTESALTAARMTEANEAVRAAFNLRVAQPYQIGDITNYAVAVSDTTVPHSLPNTNAGRYGTLLAAMPRAARLFLGTLPSPALTFLRQLVKDIVDDGVVNASVDDAEPKAYDNSLPQVLDQALASAIADYGQVSQPAPGDVATTCLNPALFTVGTTWSLNYLDTPVSGAATTSSLSLQVTRTTTFDKYNPALEVKLFDGLETIYTYFNPDISAGLASYGSSLTSSAQGVTLNYVNVFSPPSVSRQFLLKVGETDNVSATSTQTIYNPDGSVFQAGTTTTTSRSTTFVGYETVTVPAGVFKNACKYTTTDSSGTTTSWITSSGQGVEVRSVDPLGTLEVLQAGTVNGQPVK